MSVLQNDKTRTGHYGGVDPSKTEKVATDQGGAGNVEVPASRQRVNVRRMNVIKLDLRERYKETAQDELVLRREQTERTENSRCKRRHHKPSNRKETERGCTVRLFGTNNL